MAQLENNLNVENEIAFATEINAIKLASLGIHTNSPTQLLNTINGAVSVYGGQSTAELELRFFVDQLDKRPLIIIAMELEQRIADFAHNVNAMFLNRNVHEREDGARIIDYKLKLNSYDTFLKSLQILARKRVDKDFTIALETKLSED